MMYNTNKSRVKSTNNYKENENIPFKDLKVDSNCSKVKKITGGKTLQWISVSFFFIILFLLAILTFQYIKVSGLNKQIEIQEQTLEDLKKTKLSLSGEVDGIRSSDELAKEAKYKLGMVYPEDDQVIYIDVNSEEEDSKVNDNVFLSPVISVLKLFSQKGQ